MLLVVRPMRTVARPTGEAGPKVHNKRRMGPRLVSRHNPLQTRHALDLVVYDRLIHLTPAASLAWLAALADTMRLHRAGPPIRDSSIAECGS